MATQTHVTGTVDSGFTVMRWDPTVGSNAAAGCNNKALVATPVVAATPVLANGRRPSNNGRDNAESKTS